MKNICKNLKNPIVQKIFCKDNLIRDVIIIFAAVLFSSVAIGYEKMSYNKDIEDREEARLKKNAIIEERVIEDFQDESRTKTKSIQDSVNIENWKNYQSNWYGFEIKYPKKWKSPRSVSKDGAEYRFGFRKLGDSENEYIGFDVAIYDIDKTKEFTSTTEFPKLKSNVDKNNEIVRLSKVTLLKRVIMRLKKSMFQKEMIVISQPYFLR
jgi:hypothetical protein